MADKEATSNFSMYRN